MKTKTSTIILYSVLGFLVFIGIMYFIKHNKEKIINSTSNDKFSPEMKKYAKKATESILEKVFHPKPKRKKCENKNENHCRSVLEKIFNKPFPTIRPDFLKSPKTGKNLELDCFNEDMGLALEYNGVQHYKFSPYFHKTKKDFLSQVHRDDWKRNKCREKGIILLEIPYWITMDKLENYIKKELKKKGINY